MVLIWGENDFTEIITWRHNNAFHFSSIREMAFKTPFGAGELVHSLMVGCPVVTPLAWNDRSTPWMMLNQTRMDLNFQMRLNCKCLSYTKIKKLLKILYFELFKPLLNRQMWRLVLKHSRIIQCNLHAKHF